jgi:hypothetical protein
MSDAVLEAIKNLPVKENTDGPWALAGVLQYGIFI